MSQDPNEQFDHAVLDKIEASSIGAVPTTPAYQDALKRLYATHQVYADADHKDGHVTARSLTKLPAIHAQNLDELRAGKIVPDALESNASIFDRYVASLSPDRRVRAEARRLVVAGKPVHHRKHHGAPPVHDLVHSLFLVPGSGPHPGLPGNYLYGSLYETGHADKPWAINLHDSDDGAAVYEAADLAGALAKLEEVMASAPFKMEELEALEFRIV